MEKRPYHHGNLREDLVQATLELIAEHGVRGFKVADAAQRTEVSPGAPYRHFPDREALLVAAAQEAADRLAALVSEAIAAAEDPIERLAAVSAAYVAAAARGETGFDVVYANGIDKKAHPELARSTRQAVASLVPIALELAPDAERAIDLLEAQVALAQGFVALLGAGFFQARPADPDAVAERAAAATRALVDGFGSASR